jgi:hypothetical protein
VHLALRLQSTNAVNLWIRLREKFGETLALNLPMPPSAFSVLSAGGISMVNCQKNEISAGASGNRRSISRD